MSSNRGVLVGSEQRHLWNRFRRFFVVGAAAFLVDVGALYLTMAVVGIGPLAARIPAFLVAATFSWSVNRAWTFGPSGRHLTVEWGRFLLANLSGWIVNLFVYLLVLSVSTSLGATGPAIGVACGAAAGLIFNFAATQLYVFARDH